MVNVNHVLHIKQHSKIKLFVPSLNVIKDKSLALTVYAIIVPIIKHQIPIRRNVFTKHVLIDTLLQERLPAKNVQITI